MKLIKWRDDKIQDEERHGVESGSSKQADAESEGDTKERMCRSEAGAIE